MSRPYEVMVIFDPTFDERNIAATLEPFLDVIRSSGGSVENVDIWGRRKLAYEINRCSEGIYTVVNVDSGSDAVAELERQLSLQESVLRLKVVRSRPPRGTKAAEKMAAKA